MNPNEYVHCLRTGSHPKDSASSSQIYSLENNFKKLITNKNQVLLANINFQIILNRGAMKRMLILPPTSTLLIKKIIARDYIMRKYILK